MPGLGNVDPAGYVRLHDAARSGDRVRAAGEQARLRELFEIIGVADRGRIGFTAGALGGFKSALHALGVLDSPRTSDPLGSLTAAEHDEVARIVRSSVHDR